MVAVYENEICRTIGFISKLSIIIQLTCSLKILS